MISLVPTPKISNVNDESYHPVAPSIHSQTEKWHKYINSFSEIFDKIFGITLSNTGGGIELIEDLSIKAGAYKIETKDTFKIYASDDEGIAYGLSSVLQLVKVSETGIRVQDISVEDWADKDYRALMVDLGREWHPFDKLLRFVDVCFMFKIKYLNLHFTDTLLYTLPSKAYPKLSSEGKHYSFEQIEYLNKYASAKGVVLIPEYECPGHAPLLTRAYPEIFADKYDNDSVSEYYTETGELVSSDELICAGSDTAWQATKIILREICDMFPDAPYINIGGDEANIKLWNECSVCREYMGKHGLADEYELYSEYIARVTDYIFELGKTPLVWEGFPKKGCERINKDTIVIAWESHYHLAPDLLKAGFRIINSSWQPLYIVPCTKARWDTYDILAWNVYNWQHWWEKSVATLNPISVEPTDRVLGAMLCTWQQCFEEEIRLVMENLSAMSERCWSTARVCTDDEFLEKHKPLMGLVSKVIRDV
ncbi:MAG: family 20 glycosylhydrolase [Clostridia bacterium]|nr:family 20 glycosylhydrolase [Clostridia bacterium]